MQRTAVEPRTETPQAERLALATLVGFACSPEKASAAEIQVIHDCADKLHALIDQRRPTATEDCTTCEEAKALLCRACVRTAIEEAVDSYIDDKGHGHCIGCVTSKSTKKCPGVEGADRPTATDPAKVWRGRAGEVFAEGLTPKGPWRVFVGEYGVATFPSAAAADDPEAYAHEVAHSIQCAISDDKHGAPRRERATACANCARLESQIEGIEGLERMNEDGYEKTIADLRATLDVFRKALTFYADAKAYSNLDPRYPGKTFSKPIEYDTAPENKGALWAAGERARMALALDCASATTDVEARVSAGADRESRDRPGASVDTRASADSSGDPGDDEHRLRLAWSRMPEALVCEDDWLKVALPLLVEARAEGEEKGRAECIEVAQEYAAKLGENVSLLDQQGRTRDANELAERALGVKQAIHLMRG